VKHREPDRHPGIWRVMQVDSELAGILIAAGFVLMGLVGMPIAKWFFLGAVGFGVVVALVLRWTQNKPLQSIGLGPESPRGSQKPAPQQAGPAPGIKGPKRDHAQRQPRLSATPA
jgi:hypothetical protein